QLAVNQIRHKEWEGAEVTLKQNLELLHADPELDQEAYESTLFALAGLLYQRGKYLPAVQASQEALDHFPTSPSATQAGFQLAVCCRQLAAQEKQRLLNVRSALVARGHYEDEYRKWLDKAAAHFQKLADDLGTRPSRASRNEEEEGLLRQATYAVAECKFDRGQYEAAAGLFEAFADRFPQHGEALNALGKPMPCHPFQKQ